MCSQQSDTIGTVRTVLPANDRARRDGLNLATAKAEHDM